MKIKDLLDKKGYDVFTVKQDVKVAQVVEILFECNVGDVLVKDDNGKMIGIVSERDIVRKCIYKKQRVDETLISEIMTKDLIVALVDDDVEYVLGLMTKNRIRHVPVVSEDNGDLIGLVSIGDLVKAIVEDKEVENRYLIDYISHS